MYIAKLPNRRKYGTETTKRIEKPRKHGYEVQNTNNGEPIKNTAQKPAKHQRWRPDKQYSATMCKTSHNGEQMESKVQKVHKREKHQRRRACKCKTPTKECRAEMRQGYVN